MAEKIFEVILNPVNVIFEFFFLVWFGFSVYWINKLYRRKNPNVVNPYLYEAIPGVFITIGVCGTFTGVFVGLWNFDTDKITDSIPFLLEGLKTAFATSISGLFLSFIFGRISQSVLYKVEIQTATNVNTELAALQEIISILKESKIANDKNFQLLNKSLTGDSDSSILTQIIKWRNQFNDYSRETKKNIEWIVKSMNDNNALIGKKFDEFAELLAKNNTEALVEVMKKATEQFNEQMSALIDKLVQENFQELNSSVQQLNGWQHENKEMITKLTVQFTKVSEDFAITSEAIKEITENTTRLLTKTVI